MMKTVRITTQDLILNLRYVFCSVHPVQPARFKLQSTAIESHTSRRRHSEPVAAEDLFDMDEMDVDIPKLSRSSSRVATLPPATDREDMEVWSNLDGVGAGTDNNQVQEPRDRLRKQGRSPGSSIGERSLCASEQLGPPKPSAMKRLNAEVSLVARQVILTTNFLSSTRAFKLPVHQSRQETERARRLDLAALPICHLQIPLRLPCCAATRRTLRRFCSMPRSPLSRQLCTLASRKQQLMSCFEQDGQRKKAGMQWQGYVDAIMPRQAPHPGARC